MADDISFTGGIYVEEAEVQEIIQILRKMDPPGLGARNLQDCLLMQLERSQDEKAPIAIEMVKKRFEDLAARNYEKLMRLSSLTADQLKDIITAGLACEHITLEGDGRHWYATIVSAPMGAGTFQSARLNSTPSGQTS